MHGRSAATFATASCARATTPASSPPERRPALVAPGLSPLAREALTERVLTAAVCEPLDRLSERFIELVVLALEGERLPNHVILPMDLVTPENL